MLAGLVTVNDVLRFTALEKPEIYPSWDTRGGLDGVLEEVWNWGSGVVRAGVGWGRRIVRR